MRCTVHCSMMMMIFQLTKPRPAVGRLGLGGSSESYTWVHLSRVCFSRVHLFKGFGHFSCVKQENNKIPSKNYFLRDLVISPVSSHFLNSREFVVSPMSKHFCAHLGKDDCEGARTTLITAGGFTEYGKCLETGKLHE